MVNVRSQTASVREVPGGAEELFVAGRNVWRVAHADSAHVLVDAADYFGMLRRSLLAARRRVVVLGWDFDSRTPLVGTNPPDDGLPEELGPFLTALVTRTPSLSVKILVWKSPLPYALEREPALATTMQSRTPPRIEFAFDDELPSGSAQHQKIVVIDDAVAFCGGLDLTIRRWDTREHRPGDARRVDPAGVPYAPFHDVQMLVTGDAAAALGVLASERWLQATDEALPPLERSGLPAWPGPAEPRFRDVAVGIARTVPAVEGVAEVREVQALFEDMIAVAERSIYIENQFLTCLPVAEALAARMRERPELEVLIVAPMRHHTWIEHTTMQNGRLQFIDVFREQGLGDRIALLGCEVSRGGECDAVMIHAKVMIVDDRVLRVGSANLANRSMGADSECDLVLVAGGRADRRTVREIRDGLIAEHCGCSREAITAAIDASGSLLAALPTAGDGCRLVPVDREDAMNVGIAWLADPDRPLSEIEPLASLGGGERPRGGRRRWIATVAIVAACALAGIAWQFSGVAALADPQQLADQLGELPRGVFGALLVAGVFVLAGLVAFPVTLLIAATAIAFGAWPGVAYAAFGALASATATYTIGRTLGPDALRNRMGPRLTRLREAVTERGVLAVAGVRLLPIAPFSIVNLIAGAFRIPVFDYLLGTLIGLLPGLVLLTALGDRLAATLREPTMLRVVLLLAVLVAWGLLSFGLQGLISRWRHRR
jgi:phospholipase D1/2